MQNDLVEIGYELGNLFYIVQEGDKQWGLLYVLTLIYRLSRYARLRYVGNKCLDQSLRAVGLAQLATRETLLKV
jgi:hypothetical protein